MIYVVLGALLVILSSTIYGPPLLKAARTYFQLWASQKRLCPETDRYVLIQINAARAARTVLTSGMAEIQVKDCTRWPERRGCAQGCVSEADDAGAHREDHSRLARQQAG
ncbi:hypothetical protein ACFLQ0_04795 [Nitrospinota bacterium]